MGKQPERRFFTAAESAQIWDRFNVRIWPSPA